MRPDLALGLRVQLANVLTAQAAIDRQIADHMNTVEAYLSDPNYDRRIDSRDQILRASIALCMRLEWYSAQVRTLAQTLEQSHAA